MHSRKIIRIITILGGFFLVVGVILQFLVKDAKIVGDALNTQINKNITGYRLDLRINGIYKNKVVNETVMVNNYKNTDKEISIFTKQTENGEEKYIIKDGKYYQVINDSLKEIKAVPYEDTDIYLEGIKKITSVKKKGKEIIGNNEYTVYTGKISKSLMNKMLSKTATGIQVEKSGKAEVWLTADNHVYKIYYKADNITLYPSYFKYNLINPIDLDSYKIK